MDDEFIHWVVVNEVNSVVVVLLDLLGQTRFDIDTGQLTHVPSLPVKSPTKHAEVVMPSRIIRRTVRMLL